MANDIFQDFIDQIKDFYQEHNYELGWRFLTCSKAVLKSNPKIAFITLNPGGSRMRDDHPSASCEEGSPYLNESWGGKKPGESKLQIQIQKMFNKIHEKLNYPDSKLKLVESTLSGHFVPFRSPRLESLEYKKEAFDFGEKLWSKILQSIQPPELFVCIDHRTTKRIRKIIATIYNLPEGKPCKLETGWGNTTAEIFEFGDNAQIKILRLPHLSRFTLFTREKCKKEVENIFTRFCCKT